jgi:hypothetical protein
MNGKNLFDFVSESVAQTWSELQGAPLHFDVDGAVTRCGSCFNGSDFGSCQGDIKKCRKLRYLNF